MRRLATATRIPSSRSNNLGLLLQDQGKYDEAEPLLREALKVRRETLGDRHPDTLISINNLGMLLKDQGKSTRRSRCSRGGAGLP